MQVCSNCGAQITCGCQKRTASNGTSVCTHCVTDYEKKLTELNAVELKKQENNKKTT